MGTSYYNADTGGYSDLTTRSGKRINHIVTIVGWDDNYSKDNFLSKSKVTADGAMDRQNSWGSDWGDEGYFYLSYQDPNISNLVAAEASAVEDQQYKNNYFYDGSSAVTTVQITTGESVAAIYIAGGRKRETGVSGRGQCYFIYGQFFLCHTDIHRCNRQPESGERKSRLRPAL